MMKTVTKQIIGMLALILTGLFLLSAQSLTINGKVTDSQTGKGIGSVKIVGPMTTVYSDANGNFKIQAQKGDLLRFSKESYQSADVHVTSDYLTVTLTKKLDVYTIDVVEDRIDAAVQDVQYEISETASIRGNRSDKQIVIVDGVKMKTESSYLRYDYDTPNNEAYDNFNENRFLSVKKEPLSTFSLDVDAASYSNMRRFVNQGQLPPADAIRTEELINYFSYRYDAPTGKDPVSINSEISECPWNRQHYLVKVGIKAKEIPSDNLPASNFVFLIDVSGSMYGPTRLELVKSSLKLLVNNLREKDRVAIVVYAGAAGEVLPSTSGADKAKILEAINNLVSGGSTAGGAGINLAYKIAEKNFIPDGNNRIILCTDGDFNVGISNNDDLGKLIEEKRTSGVFLTILGYGMGNYKDSRMQVLAQKGNGNHAYIDNIQEANKVLVKEFGSSMYAVAKDVKLQVEFNPEHIAQYRLIGYESRLLANEDFNDDTKDAGELGAGHTVTALYEVIPVGVKSSFNNVDPLKYQKEEAPEIRSSSLSDELMTIKLRYKEIDSDVSKMMEKVVMRKQIGQKNSEDFQFIMSVALFGQLLRASDFVKGVSYSEVVALARQGLGDDPNGYRREFVRLVEAVAQLKK